MYRENHCVRLLLFFFFLVYTRCLNNDPTEELGLSFTRCVLSTGRFVREYGKFTIIMYNDHDQQQRYQFFFYMYINNPKKNF